MNSTQKLLPSFMNPTSPNPKPLCGRTCARIRPEGSLVEKSTLLELGSCLVGWLQGFQELGVLGALGL